MAFLWIFTILWCGFSLTMVSIAVKTSEPWYVLAFLSLFVIVGIGLAVGLIVGLYQRRRLGRATLEVSPKDAQRGEPVTLKLQLSRDDLGDRNITFTLEAQENDEGWSTQEKRTQIVRLHAAMRQTSVRFTLPHGARASSASWRWRASARVEGLKYAPVECDVAVLPVANPNEPSNEVITLHSAAAEWPAHDTSETAPPGAREIASGVWLWHSSSRVAQIIGVVLIAFALFWLWNTVNFSLPRLGSRGDGAFSWGEVAVALFGLPFLLVGLLLVALGFVLLTFKQSATIRRGEFRTTVEALGHTWSTRNLRASDINFLQAASNLSSGHTVLRYDLAARTTRGAVILPYSAKSTSDLTQQARWAATVLGIEGVQFDPQMLASDTPRFTLDSDALMRKRTGRWIGRIMGGAIALGFGGFALLFVTSLWKS